MSSADTQTWTRTERRQRIEELLEQYGLRPTFELDAGAVRLPWASFATLSLDGTPLTPPRLIEVAGELGVAIAFDVDLAPPMIAIEWMGRGDESFDALEGGLIDLLEILREQNPLQFLGRSPLDIHIPQTSELPQSSAFLARMVEDDFIVREKKPAVIDLNRTRGAYMVSVDDDPLVLLEAMSQISTLPGGFSPAPVEAALDEGRFDDLLIHADSTTPEAQEATAAYEAMCNANLHPRLRHYSHANSGAESNEKAFYLSRLNGPGGKRVIGFKGSFHGRTMISLFSTWNPVKRGPYEIPGYESLFATFPFNKNPKVDPDFDASWVALWSTRDGDEKMEKLEEARVSDELLSREIESLLEVETLLKRSDVCCLIVEPMQSEGGDNYGTRRFFNGLRAITRTYDTPMVVDEVQTGLRLGRDFFWHTRFELRDAKGEPDCPDVVSWAKKFQIGGIVSVWEDPTPTDYNPAGALRGALHEAVFTAAEPEAIEGIVYEELAALKEALPDGLVGSPRALGYAFAFDLPTAPIADGVVKQRFYRGTMVYKAGSHTLRYRLNTEFTRDRIATLFRAIRASLEAVVEWAGGVGDGGTELWARMDEVAVPAWMAPPAAAEPGKSMARRVRDELRTRAADDDYASSVAAQITTHPDEGIEDAVMSVLGPLGADVFAVAASMLGVEADYSSPREAVVQGAQTWFERSYEFRSRSGASLAHAVAAYLAPRVVVVSAADWPRYRDGVTELQKEVYEEARREDPAWLDSMMAKPDTFTLIGLSGSADGAAVVGFSMASPLEDHDDVDGPNHDARLGAGDTLYSVDVTTHPGFRGRWLGLRLKAAQVRHALGARDAQGEPRYRFVTGRNRVGHTDEMSGLNSRFGAYAVATYEGQYGESTGRALYYRIPLRRSRRPDAALAPPQRSNALIDAATGIVAPLGHDAPILKWARKHGRFDRAATTKLTLSNFVTPDYARYVESLRLLAPSGCPHYYATSCRAEMADKTVRALKVARPQAEVAISFDGAYFGESTAATRSLTDGSDQPNPERFGWFSWRFAPHPGHEAAADVPEDTLRRLFAAKVLTPAASNKRKGQLSAQIGELPATVERELDSLLHVERALLETKPERVLGVFLESIQERTGLAPSKRYWLGLQRLLDVYDVPLVVSEVASGLYRSGTGSLWLSESLGISPSVVLWYAGGQMGHVFVADRYFLAKPLQLISTWDGDELSARRLMWTMRHLRRHPPTERARSFEASVVRVARRLGQPDDFVTAKGLYAGIRAPSDRSDALLAALERRGIRARAGFGPRVILAPSLTSSGRDLARIATGLESALRELMGG